MVDGIDELFRIEREYRKRMYTATRVAELRNQGSFKECLDKIFGLLEGANPSPKSRLEAAVRYILGRKQSFLNIQTAIANGLKARDYLEKLITGIPENPKEEELGKLAPGNTKS